MNNIPEQYRPLSPWEYFGLTILFSIPFIGWIFLISAAIGSYNINKRNFARSYFCIIAIVLIIFIILFILGFTFSSPGTITANPEVV